MNITFPRRSLEEVAASVDYGVTASASSVNVGPQFLRITDIQDDRVDWATVPFCEASAAEEEAARLGEGDIVFARTGATTGKSYLIRACPERAVFASYLIRVRPDRREVEPRYLAWYFQTPDYWRQISSSASGTAQPGVNATKLKAVSVPTPPLPEQRRIADLLDKADAIRRKRKEAIALTEELLRSAFLEMFGDPVTNPKGWEVKPLGELTELIDYGVTASATTASLGPKFLRITDIQDNRVDWGAVPYCECDTNTAARARLMPGDIVFARTGATTGKSFWIRHCPENAVFASYLIRVRPARRLTSGYLSEFFQSAGYWSQILSMAEGAAQPGVNASKLANLKVPVPPIDRQRELDGLLTRIARLQESSEAALGSAESLFSSLVAASFRGELTDTKAAGKPQLGLFEGGR